jgi:hypothetical protein
MILEPPKTDDIYLPLKKLEKRSAKIRRRLQDHPSAKKFFTKSSLIAHDLRQKSTQLLAGAGLTGTLLLSPVNLPTDATASAVKQTEKNSPSVNQQLSRSLQSLVPHTPTSLTPNQAKTIETEIKTLTGLNAKAVLENQQLNHQVGYIGYEQHLQRYPGDTIADHDDEQVAGIAPGLGAWGYFAPDKTHFTTTDYLQEKYYSVAQTLYLPNWNSNFAFLRDWYKHRKILIINPTNGQAVVTVLGDSGPAEWTGKQFGGSPETMKALDLHLGPRKGLVLFLFLDDPNNLVPLGPLTAPYNLNNNP